MVILGREDELDKVFEVYLFKNLIFVQSLPSEKTNTQEKICKFIASLQDEETGSFSGDEYGEVDTRFSYCATRSS